MPNFLLIESSSHNCSVAVCNAEKILAIRQEASSQYVHSEKLHVFIKEVMLEAGLAFSDLAAVCVGRGPGSYTGLRIGVSAAKGLCFSLNIPLISLSSLQILASPFFHQVGGLIMPLMDARRMEVYQAVYTETGEMIGEIEAKILDENSYAEELSHGKVHFMGDGCEKATEVIKHENAVFHRDVLYPSALQMQTLCVKKYQQKQFEDTAYFEPYYLKDFVAGKAKRVL